VRNKFLVKNLSETAHRLARWSTSDFAEYLITRENTIIDSHYTSLPGYRFMHAGISDGQLSVSNFSQIHGFTVQSYHAEGCPMSSFVADLSDLPLPSEVVDIALLQHVLEFSCSPQMVLADICRVISPGGHLIICVLNPFGPMGLSRWPLQLLTDRVQYRFHSLRCGRLIDWLALLNFEVDRVHHGAYHLPAVYSRAQEFSIVPNRFSRLMKYFDKGFQRVGIPCGNFYMIHAVKRVRQGVNKSSRKWTSVSRPRMVSSVKKTVEPLPTTVNSVAISTINNRVIT
jgi:SAM-dependent methyltransferase